MLIKRFEEKYIKLYIKGLELIKIQKNYVFKVYHAISL
jgi:hypothetical protein